MKTSSALAFGLVALAIGFFAARWSTAQTANRPSTQESSSYDFGALQQYESFISYLQDTKQTNILKRFNDYSNASLTLQHDSDLGMTLMILKALREGRTNQVYKLLETRVDADIVGFAASYSQLPASLQRAGSLDVLRLARDYRAKHSYSLHLQVEDDAVAGAFKILKDQ
jgi:hypothetical protein